MMQAAGRHAASALVQRCSLQLAGQQTALPALTFQVTSLASLASSLREPASSAREQRRHRWQTASGGTSTGGWASALVPPSEQQRLSQQPWRQQLWLPTSSSTQAQWPHHQQQHQQQQRPIFNFAGFGGDLSKSYHEKKLLGWSPRQVYDVVAKVEDYHHFVPWCQRSTVLLRQPPAYLEAELEVGFQMFVERYTSKVTLHCPSAVHSRVEESTLFSHLTNKWEFRLGPTPHTTWLTFEVDFAFKSPLYRQVASVFFEEVVQRMMGAFEGRCAQVYGPSSLHRRPGPAQQVAAGGR